MLVLRSISQSENTSVSVSPSNLSAKLALSVQSERSPRMAESVKLSTTNLYIKGLHVTTTDESLKLLCQGHGTILSTKAVLDPNTNQCKGFGFVDFETAECAQAALEALRQQGYQVGMAKKQEQADTNVFFKNLPEDMTKEQLEAWVKECGVVSSVHIMKQNGRSQGVGFARMTCKEDCQRVIDKYNNLLIQGNKAPLLVKFADLPNRHKKEARAQTVQELQGAVTVPAGHPPYVFQGPPPQATFSMAAHAYPENGVGAMTMAGAPGIPQVPGMPALHGLMPMSNPYPTMPQYPSLSAAANGYSFVSLGPAPGTYPTLQTQYGDQMFTAPQSAYYLPSTAAATMQQVVPGMQPHMDPTMGSVPQWQ